MAAMAVVTIALNQLHKALCAPLARKDQPLVLRVLRVLLACR
jgi:hypothetical protein